MLKLSQAEGPQYWPLTAVACKDFFKGRGEKKKKGHIQHVLATEEGTLVWFANQEGTLAHILAPKRAP